MSAAMAFTPEILLVDGSGNVPAVLPGSGTVQATAGTVAATHEVTVPPVAARMVISPESVTLSAVGQ